MWLNRQQEDNHRRREEQGAVRREGEGAIRRGGDRHNPEQVEERELREAHERDRQAQHQYRPGASGVGRVSPYSGLALGQLAEYHARKRSTGYQPAAGGDYPPGVTGSHYTASTTVPSHSPYHQTSVIQPQSAKRYTYNCGPSPSPYGGYQPPLQPQHEEGMLPPPEGFSRPPNDGQSYTFFDTLKIRDMDDLIDSENMPRMPAVLTTHDVRHDDWIRFMRDLSDAWLGRLPVPESAKQDGRLPKRAVMATDLVEVWNDSFFGLRGIELIIYKGRERRNGRYAGRLDMDLPGFDITADDITDSDEGLAEQDSDEDYAPPSGARYGSYGARVYGRHDPTTLEGRDARLRRKAIREEERRRRKEREARRRVRDLGRTYTIYLTCMHG